MPTNNALTAMLLWIAAGLAALMLAGLVSLAESAKHKGELRRLNQSLSGQFLLPGEMRHTVAYSDDGQGTPELIPLAAQSLAAR